MLESKIEHETIAQKVSTNSTSALRKYQGIYVGSTSLYDFVKYEFLTSVLTQIPGALGFFLRKVFFKHLFAKVGGGSVFGRNITLRCPGQIYLGDNIAVDSNVVLDAKGRDSSIHMGGEIFIGKDTIFSCSSASITVGESVSIGPSCYVRASRGPVVIGSYVTIGGHTVIISGNPDYRRFDIPMMNQEGQARGVFIGDDVWLGVGVRLIDGVKIGNGCVVGAGAVVTKAMPDYSISAGVPARIIGRRKQGAPEQTDRDSLK